MPPPEEIRRSLYGALRIAILDPDALSHFNLTEDGFWRSFFAMAPSVLLYALLNALPVGELPMDEEGPSLLFTVPAHAVLYLVIWVAYLLAMIPVTRLLRLSHRYVGFVVVWNWASLAQIMVLAGAALLAVAFGGSLAAVVLAAWLALLVYGFLVAWAGLQCDPLTAIGVIAFETAFGLLFSYLGDGLIMSLV